jgi:hypothetical protein
LPHASQRPGELRVDGCTLLDLRNKLLAVPAQEVLEWAGRDVTERFVRVGYPSNPTVESSSSRTNTSFRTPSGLMYSLRTSCPANARDEPQRSHVHDAVGSIAWLGS